MKRALPILAPFLAACASVAPPPPAAAPPEAGEPAITVVLASELRWEQLNPARGDQSPKAADLWGDRKGPGPTGFLVEFVDGFSSPPHIHNVTYRGVVLEQQVHNDDPGAAELWMPAGSFWTQPKGEAHITSAHGAKTRAYIEIDEGPYLVRPVDQAFDSGERPVNLHASNIVWVDASATAESAAPSATPPAKRPRVAFLWDSSDDGGLSGRLVKLPAGSTANLVSPGATARAVAIQGRPAHHAAGGSVPTPLLPGSYLGVEGGTARVSCAPDQECVFYVRAEGRFSVVPAVADPR